MFFRDKVIECRRCINTSQNPCISFNKKGYCNICQIYQKNFRLAKLIRERKLFRRLAKNKNSRHDLMVGISGGKDSSATLWQIKQMGLNPLAFTLDTGYLHKYIFKRARAVAEKLGVDYKIIPIKRYITTADKKRFQQLAQIYRRDRKEEFLKDYYSGRQDYSGVVRPCWVCRRILIRAYYAEALKYRVKVVVLGINEWASLKSTTRKGNFGISAFRKIRPFKDKPPIYIVHLPFLLQMKLEDTKAILKKMGWNYYRSVQSNAASCLLACAAEKQLAKHLGFHPDSTRLAREVTIGFLSKAQAEKALEIVRKCKYSVPQILKKAKLI